MPKKILLYCPDENLKNKIKRFSPEEFKVVGTIESDEVNTFNDFDYICISSPNYRETKKKLSETFDDSIIHTYEELRVLGSEKKVNESYLNQWQKSNACGLKSFENKKVIILGGSSGIGYSCAEAFALLGADIIVAGRNKKKLKDAAKKLDAKYMQWDIQDIARNDENLEEALRLSGGRIDIVINSAGIYDSDSVSFFDVSEELYDNVMDTNLKGAFFLCRTFAKYFIENTIRGHIVNVVSETGCTPTVKPYGMSKWGLWGLTKGLGLNLAKFNITVNGIAPGEVATGMTGWGGELKKNEPARRAPQTGRVLFTREVAEVILFLAGKAGENMPGEVVLCNGGGVWQGAYIGFNY